MKPVSLVQVGLGPWGLDWARTVLPEVPLVAPAAYVEADETARKRALEAGLPAELIFASLDAALASTRPEALLATVALSAHAAVARAGLEAGLHVLVEKPFAETVEQARALVVLAEQAGLMLVVNQNYRYFPASQAARALVADGAIGAPLFLRVHFARLFDAGYRYFFLAEPLLSDMAIHHLDLLRFILQDEPVAVSCVSRSEPGTPYAGPPAAYATIRFAKGTLVQYDGSWISRGPQTAYGGEWHLDATAGAAAWTFRGAGADRLGLDRLDLFRPDEPPAAAPLPDVPLADRLGVLDAFARAVRKGTADPLLSTGADNLASLALMQAAIRSTKQGGAWIEVAP